MSLTERKLIELNQKLDSLEREFSHWRDQSEAFKPLEKHHTQIRRITYQLEGIQRKIRAELKGLSQSNAQDILAEARRLERDILEVHRIWEFFRSKLALRSVSWFNSYLVAADEFAWACYSTAQQNFKYDAIPRDDLREPPLVFFNGGSSPYTLPRHLTFQAEEVEGEELRLMESSELLKELSIPVIGVPWFQVQHLPDALVIGHEVGHDVEEDFQLTKHIETLLDEAMEASAVDAAHRTGWRSWLRETFADLYGNLASGPAFVESLMDFLATDKTLTETDRRTDPAWGSYPPDYLRVLINLAALDLLGFTHESKRLKEELERTYSTHAMQDFVEDIPPIVKALVDEPYPEFNHQSLRQVMRFTKVDHDNAVTASQRLLNGMSPTVKNIRVLMASARLAYSLDAEKYKSKNAHNLVLGQVPKTQTQGVRGARSSRRVRGRDQADLDNYDISVGEKLYEKMKQRKRTG